MREDNLDPDYFVLKRYTLFEFKFKFIENTLKSFKGFLMKIIMKINL